jgi:uncharacterized protein YhfF
MNRSCEELWALFLASGSESAAEAREARYSCWQFGIGSEQGDRLLACVQGGAKRATAGALAAYEHDGEPLPACGDFSVITDGSGVARCVVRTTRVDVVAFDRVDADHAHAEGEGDRSLRGWRAAHWDFFTRELAVWGQAPTGDMLVVCERFELLFVAGDPASQ